MIYIDHPIHTCNFHFRMAVDFSQIPQEGMISMEDHDGSGMVGGSKESYDPNLYEFLEVKNFMVDGGDRFGVTSVSFDGQEELLWMGNHGVSAGIPPGIPYQAAHETICPQSSLFFLICI